MIESTHCMLRLAKPSDVARIIEFYEINKTHFAPWDPKPPIDFYTSKYWLQQINSARSDYQNDKSLKMCVFLKENNQLIGKVTFTQFERGPFQNCRLGYKIGSEYEGKGLMHETLLAAIQHIFTQLNFHRVEANCIPRNNRSRNLLKRLGFQEHGIAPRYLNINGVWEDHVLTSLLAE